jgi:hypothetical protein
VRFIREALLAREKNDDFHPPVPDARDRAHGALSTVLSFVGAAELFNFIVGPPNEKRLQEWRERIGELSEKIEGMTVEALQENPVFISVVNSATRSALLSHREEKREALQNAILNVAAGRAPDEDLQLVFLGYIDTFTPMHLRILALVQNPKQ